MAEQTENTTATQQLNKRLWMQALDELEREYIAFQRRSPSPAGASSARPRRARSIISK